MNDFAGAGARFVNIGERTNVTGSAKFKKLILSDDYDAAVTVARDQSDRGARAVRGPHRALDAAVAVGQVDAHTGGP